MNDITFALRTLLRTPAFTLTATATLALGIGATTAIFSVVNAVLLQPLPYREPGRLVVTRLSLPDYQDLKRASRSFEATAVWASNLYNLRNGDEGRQVLGGVISRELLPLLGVSPALGRSFSASDDTQKTVVLGYGLWQSVFGGDPNVLGRTVDLSGTAYTVIGVTPAGFSFPTGEFQLWTPMGLLETDARPQATNRALRIFSAVGRLKEGVTFAQARDELRTIGSELARTYPATNTDVELQLESLTERLVGDVRTSLLVVLGTVALLLLIACANVANLMLARTAARRRELAIRSAMGAGKWRLVRQLTVESVVLGCVGGACGLLLAMWTVDLLPAVLAARVPRAEAVGVDGAVLLAALAATFLTTLLFGVAPALYTRADVSALKDAGRGLTGASRSRTVRRGIVVAEVGLAVVVVVGAGLLVRSFFVLTARDPGIVPADLVSFNVQFVKLPTGEARASAAAALVDRLASLPGVEAAGGATGLPTVTPQRATRFEIEGRQLTPAESQAYFIAAAGDYFRAAGTPIVRGRGFERSDTSAAQPVAVINRVIADQLFAGQDPIGRRIRVINPEYPDAWRTIVGVVGNIRYRGLDTDVQPTLYTSFAQTPFPWLYMMVRTSGDGTALMQSIRRVTREVDPALIAAEVRPMRDIVTRTVAEPRFSMLLLSGFAALALALAAVGIYGVIAYSVAQRTQEIGVRMALGAARGDVLRMVMREGAAVAGFGLVLGLACSALLVRLMTELLVGIAPRDPATFAAAAAVLLFVALVASYFPARRAARVDPMAALRS